ncbi:DNA repair protein XRCC2 [Arapaima gigas]
MTHQLRSSESGAQLLARLEGRRSLKHIEPQLFLDDSSPAQGDVVEFHGMEGTGKTEMLYHLVARCILPVDTGGLEVEVMFVDTDHHFDMLRLVTILEHRLPQGHEEVVRACLGRLFIVHCNSSLQLFFTLHYAEDMFCSRPSLSLLIVDSISAFYWVDKSSGGESVSKQESNLKRCIELLEKLLKDYHIVVFATTQAIMRSSIPDRPGPSESSLTLWKQGSPAPRDFSKAYLCKPWQKIVTHKVAFSKTDTSRDKKLVFSVVSSSTRTTGTKRSYFSITDVGVQFVL